MTKQIPLSQGKYALVDDADFEWLMQWSWCFDGRYAVRGTNRNEKFYMHRVVSGATNRKEVDHIDGNKLNNTRNNLRVCTHSENNRNRAVKANNTSGFKGVSRVGRKWLAQIKINGTKMHIGVFPDPIDAAKAYDAKAKELFGDFAWTNF